MGTKEADRFEEGLDLVYHDATDEPLQTEEDTGLHALPSPENFHGGFGSESLKERIELLNATVRNSPATLHSGVGHSESTVPPHFSVSNTIKIKQTMQNIFGTNAIALSLSSGLAG